MSYLYETGSRYKNYRFSPKGKHLWEQIRRLNGFAKNLCSTYDESYCFNESLCYRRHKHLPFQCEYTDNETLAAYAKGNYDFGNLEQIEEFIVFKGALEISSYLEHKTDAPYKSECIAILKYCCDTYKDNNSYITEHLERMFPQKDETCALQEPEEEEIAETVISLDEKEEESEEQKEDLPSNDSNSSTLTLLNCPPCLPKEEECYIVECHDSFEISSFDKFYVTSSLTQENEISEIKQWLPNAIYDNALDDGPILPNDIYYTTIVKSGFNNPTVFELNINYVFVDHEKHALCESYIVEFVHDATESYYERGKYGCKSFQVTKTPLFMLKVLKLYLFHLSMLVALCFNNLFCYNLIC